MKKIISFFIVSVVIVAISFGIYNLDDKYKLNIVYDDIQWTINNKDCLEKNPAFFTENFIKFKILKINIKKYHFYVNCLFPIFML